MKERWISLSIVKHLIQERDYVAAGEVVSGSKDVFNLLRKKLADILEKEFNEPLNVSCSDVQKILEEARWEIKDHQEWESEVLDNLHLKGDEGGFTLPLRGAFKDSVKVRNELLQDVMQAHKKFLENQDIALSSQ